MNLTIQKKATSTSVARSPSNYQSINIKNCQESDLKVGETLDNRRAFHGLFKDGIAQPGKLSPKIELQPPEYGWRKNIGNSVENSPRIMIGMHSPRIRKVKKRSSINLAIKVTDEQQISAAPANDGDIEFPSIRTGDKTKINA